MGIFDSLFNSKKIRDTAADGIYNGIDMAFFTDEEKKVYDQKILDWKLEYYKATAPQNMSRRYIAVIVTILWASLVVTYVVAGILGFKDQSDFVYTALKDIVNQPFSIVAAFYFLAHVVGKNK